jgi:hypothetical protein
MEFPLAKEALYSTRTFNENLVRLRRRPDGKYLPEGMLDTECPDECWDSASARLDVTDPHGEKALDRLRKYLSSSEE